MKYSPAYLSNSIDAKQASILVVGVKGHHAFSYLINSKSLYKMRAVHKIKLVMNTYKSSRSL